jgi:hypothetical protein
VRTPALAQFVLTFASLSVGAAIGAIFMIFLTESNSGPRRTVASDVLRAIALISLLSDCLLPIVKITAIQL